MYILKIVLTAALIAVAVGAAFFGIVSAAIWFTDMKASAAKYKAWDKRTRNEIENGSSEL